MNRPSLLLSCVTMFFCFLYAESEDSDMNAPSQHRGRIVGGTSAAKGEFPWQVSLQARKRGRWDHFCGGSILSDSHIITASHCIEGLAARLVTVVAGASNIFDENEASQQRVATMVLRTHPKYNTRSLNYDSAIIHLAKPLVFNDRVKPIGLPPVEHEPLGRCVATGWGDSNRWGIGRPVFPNALQKLDMYIVNRDLCRVPYFFGTGSWVTRNMICANAFLAGSCSGDSGGPLICYDLGNDTQPLYYLAGLTSFGVNRCTDLLYPSAFTNVASQRDFIDSELKITYITRQKVNSSMSE